jgi:hypothetical protein
MGFEVWFERLDSSTRSKPFRGLASASAGAGPDDNLGANFGF